MFKKKTPKTIQSQKRLKRILRELVDCEISIGHCIEKMVNS